MGLNSDYYLKKIYHKLYACLTSEKRIHDKSALISLLDVKSNSRLRIIADSNIPSHKIPAFILNELKQKAYIRESKDEIDQIVITAKGIWTVEKDKGILDSKSFINFVDNKWFNFSKSIKPLSEKEKIIILAMIATRAFSESSAVDLKQNELVLNNWKGILNASFDFLKDNKIISKLKVNELYGKGGNEHPVSHLIRHTDALPKKTKGIYRAPGKQKYYLDVFQNLGLNTLKISYLVKLITNDKNDFVFSNKIISFCNKISFEKCIYVFDLEKHIFNKPEFELQLEGAIKSVIDI